MAGTVPPPAEVYYPDSDGQPMAETPHHRQNMTNTIEALDLYFAGDPMVYVSGNMFIYYAQGDRRKHLAPDVFVVRGVPKHRQPDRRRYLVWEEGKGPDVVIEITSESTREEHIDDKMLLYRTALPVQEYFLFDPYEEYLEPSLQGRRLMSGRWVPIQAIDGRVPSEVLGVHLERSGDNLRLYNPATGKWLLIPREMYEFGERAGADLRRAEEAWRQAEAERQRVEEAWQRAEIERQRAEQARQQADAERQRAEQARQRAEDARRQAEDRARQADAELELLRRELEALRHPRPPAS
jgi:Uma2 family endonuclease